MSERNIADMRVLAVEDDAAVCKVLERFFGSLGMKFDSSSTVSDALRQCANQHYNLLVLDYNLMTEGKIGWRIAEDIRKSPEEYGEPKIIAMSGTVNPDKAVQWLGVPKDYFDFFLNKPFDLMELESKVHDLLDA